jgi:hypothetical protein
VVVNCTSSVLRRTFLKQTTLDIVKLQELGRIHDTLESHVQIVEGKTELTTRENIDFVKQSRNSNKTSLKCFKCGGGYPHPGGYKSCPSTNVTCHECHNAGHFAKFCRQKQSQEKPTSDMVNQIESIESEQYIFSIGESEETPTTMLKVGQVELKFKIDTGASVNILDYDKYKVLKPTPKLTTRVRPTFGYSSRTALPVIGTFKAFVSSKDGAGKVVEAEFYVIKGDHGRLLSYKTSKDLGLVHIVRAVEQPESSVKPVEARPRKESFRLLEQIEKLIQEAKGNDTTCKVKMKSSDEKRLRVKPVSLAVNDMVFVKQHRTHKAISPFESVPYKITAIKGSMITAIGNGRSITRNVSLFKKWRGECMQENAKHLNEIRVLMPEPTTDQETTSSIDEEDENDDDEQESVRSSNEEEDFKDTTQNVQEDQTAAHKDTQAEKTQIIENAVKQEFVQVVKAALSVQAVVRVFEANDDGTPKSPERSGLTRESRASRNPATSYIDKRSHNKQHPP